MAGVIEGIYFAREGGAPVERVEEVEALEGCGLRGDRYCSGTGDRDAGRERRASAQHRNQRREPQGPAPDKVPGRGGSLRQRQAVLGCRRVERLTEPGMARALKGRGGMCAKVLRGGRLRSGDAIVVSW